MRCIRRVGPVGCIPGTQLQVLIRPRRPTAPKRAVAGRDAARRQTGDISWCVPCSSPRSVSLASARLPRQRRCSVTASLRASGRVACGCRSGRGQNASPAPASGLVLSESASTPGAHFAQHAQTELSELLAQVSLSCLSAHPSPAPPQLCAHALNRAHSVPALRVCTHALRPGLRSERGIAA